MSIRKSNTATPARHVSAINVAIERDAEGWSTLRFGVYPNKVGLQVFDRAAAEAIVRTANSLSERVAEGFRGLPIYEGHPDDAEWAKRNPGVRCVAVGRVPELQVTDKGLRWRAAWNEQGQRLTSGDAPTYDSYSPNWGMIPISYQGRKAFRPVELYSMGLTNRPNIPGTYIGLNEALPDTLPTVPTENQKPTNMNELLIKLLAALGFTVTAETSEADVAGFVDSAIEKINKKPELPAEAEAAVNELPTVKAQLKAAQGQVQTAVNESATLRTQLAQERAARASAVITVAVNEGRITEAQRAEWLGKLTAQGADFAAVEGELKKLKKAVNTRAQVDLAARRGAVIGDQGKVHAVNEALNAEMKATGCDRLTAMRTLKRTKPELFAEEEN